VLWILGNQAYVGRVRWREQTFPGIHEPLIDQDTFDTAQTLLKERGEDLAMRAASRAEFLLTGLYRDGNMIRNAIEQAAASDETDRAALTEKRASLAKEIARAERAIERYQDAFENGALDPARFNERLSALDAWLDALQGQRPSARSRNGRRHAHHAGYGRPSRHRRPAPSRHRPRRARASEGLLAILIADLRVNSRSEVLPTYRVGAPVVCAPTSSVGRAGIEPATLGLRGPCSAN
jgi:hypothetical protein